MTRRGRLVWLPLLAFLTLAACSPTRPFEMAAVLWDMADGPGGGGGHFLSAEPTRGPVTLDVGGRPLPADLYLPADPTGAGMVLLPGLTPAGKDDARLVDFAMVMARARFTVLVPDLSGRRDYRAGTADLPEIAAAVADLSARLEGRPVAVTGISYAAGPALLAALEPPARDRIGLVMALGGYHDMTHMVTWVTTARRRGPDGGWIAGAPPDLAVWFFVRGNLHLLNDPGDRRLLADMAERRGRDAAAPVDDLTARLGPEGRSVLTLLENRDPDAVPELMSYLPERLRRELAAMDLSARDLRTLDARLLLVHGKDDPIIPWTESANLAAAADPQRTDLFLIERLGHTELAWPDAGDAVTLWRAVWTLLSERDALAD